MTAPDIVCMDVWPSGTCTPEAMAAYKQIEAQGRIAIQRVEYGNNTDTLTVRYLADIPHQWMLELLGETKRRLEAAS